METCRGGAGSREGGHGGRTISSASSSSISTRRSTALRCSAWPRQPCARALTRRKRRTAGRGLSVTIELCAHAGDNLCEILFVRVEQRGWRLVHAGRRRWRRGVQKVEGECRVGRARSSAYKQSVCKASRVEVEVEGDNSAISGDVLWCSERGRRAWWAAEDKAMPSRRHVSPAPVSLSFPFRAAPLVRVPPPASAPPFPARSSRPGPRSEMATAQAQARLEVASGTYQKIQAELQQLVGARGRLDAQRTENEAVRKVRSYPCRTHPGPTSLLARAPRPLAIYPCLSQFASELYTADAVRRSSPRSRPRTRSSSSSALCSSNRTRQKRAPTSTNGSSSSRPRCASPPRTPIVPHSSLRPH
jgi:hypothetical protein